VPFEEGSQPATKPAPLSVAGRARLRRVVRTRAARTATRAGSDPEGAVRAAAVGALARIGALGPAALARGLSDPDPTVRRRACEEAGWAANRGRRWPPATIGLLLTATNDGDDLVAEAAAWALGEAAPRRGALAATVVGALGRMATGHNDPLCREAAVGALGALGHHAGLPAVLQALEDRPAVRRRAAVALAAFRDPAADEGLRRCLRDRDWQVRQVAEELLGTTPLTANPTPRPPTTP